MVADIESFEEFIKLHDLDALQQPQVAEDRYPRYV